MLEADSFVLQAKNDAKVRASIGKYVKLPPEVLTTIQILPPGALVTDKQLAYWVGGMKEQHMLKTSVDVAKLIVK